MSDVLCHKFIAKAEAYVVIDVLCALKLNQLVDDVEFWFPPGKDSIVEYRSASRRGNFDFDINRKRIKVKFLIPLWFSV